MAVLLPLSKAILTGWKDTVMPKMWCFALCLSKDKVPAPSASAERTTLQSYISYDLPIVEALVCYLHAAAGFPTKSTWLKSIKAWDFSTCPGLTYSNASKCCPQSVETIKGHMTQSRQGFRSTKPRAVSTPPPKSQNTSRRRQSLPVLGPNTQCVKLSKNFSR